MISRKVFLLSLFGFVFVSPSLAKTPMDRVNNSSNIPGFDNAIWENGVYVTS